MSSATPMFDAHLKTKTLVDEFEGLTAEQIRNLRSADYGRMTGRSLRPEIPANPVRRVEPREVQVEMPELEPEPISVRDMTPEEYAEFRQQIGMGQSSQYGRGILNAVNAPKASNGRHFMVNSNVEPSPAIARVSRVQVNEGNLDARPLAERFGTTSNAYRYEG